MTESALDVLRAFVKLDEQEGLHERCCDTSSSSPGPFPCDCGVPALMARARAVLAADVVPEFSPEQPVYITRDNTAHAVVEGGWGCDPDKAGPGKTMTWAQTKDTAYKPWGAWPCQSCVRALRRNAS